MPRRKTWSTSRRAAHNANSIMPLKIAFGLVVLAAGVAILVVYYTVKLGYKAYRLRYPEPAWITRLFDPNRKETKIEKFLATLL